MGERLGRDVRADALDLTVGSSVGAKEGSSVGLAGSDGRAVGLLVGAVFEGGLVGRAVGLEGFAVLVTVGSSEGDVVGDSVGSLEGRRVKVGSAVGSPVGSSVGSIVLGGSEMVGAHVCVGVRVGKRVLF